MKHPAAFINALSEEGSREEIIQYLQETWDELCNLKIKYEELEILCKERGEMLSD